MKLFKSVSHFYTCYNGSGVWPDQQPGKQCGNALLFLTDRQLLECISRNDGYAFAALMSRHYDDLFRKALLWLKDRHRAEDLVQEVFLSVWKHRQVLQSVQSPKGYLLVVLKNKMLNELRRKQPLPLMDSLGNSRIEQQSLPDHLLHNRQMGIVLRNAMQRLPPKCRNIYELSRNEGLTYDAIAAFLGISSTTVRGQMVKALSLLRRELKPYIN